MKNFLQPLSSQLLSFFQLELDGFAGEQAPSESNPFTNVNEFTDNDTEHQYDQVGGKDDETNTIPPKGLLMLPVLMKGEGFDEGDTPPETSVTLNISRGGVSDNFGISVQNENYNTLYDTHNNNGTILAQNGPDEGQFFSIGSEDGGYTSYVYCDSDSELIQCTHNELNAFSDLDVSFLINKSI